MGDLISYGFARDGGRPPGQRSRAGGQGKQVAGACKQVAVSPCGLWYWHAIRIRYRLVCCLSLLTRRMRYLSVAGSAA